MLHIKYGSQVYLFIHVPFSSNLHILCYSQKVILFFVLCIIMYARFYHLFINSKPFFSAMISPFFHSAVFPGPSFAILSSAYFCRNVIHIPVDMAALVSTYMSLNLLLYMYCWLHKCALWFISFSVFAIFVLMIFFTDLLPNNLISL